ncbi:TRAF3-interacting JNK-activating modulator isoform X3 [Lagopus leucura]|uniref:TRAF3-interacting JNK-activating modulator isoform X3 n=1 Tax=Lagopus leucura TaxID=30410 RepID=UPI001C67DB37|nr:TRAF3-interacting JNK-activating modulator isoform X3 [Lagopus leucura]
MISPPERTRPRHAGESYEEKCERRQETREALRRRGHAHSARRPGRSEEQPQSPRQREFLRRRNLGSTTGELGTPVLLQRPWSHPVCPSTLAPLGLSSPTGILAEAIPGPRTSVSSRGTQTPASTRVKDSSQQTDCGNTVFNKEIVQLSGYLKEALHRELLLKQKMVILQELLATLLHASEKSWQSYSKECVKKILIEMEDQKQTYEQKAKEALQKMLEDKLQAEQQLQNSQRCLAAAREDLAFWKEHYTMLKSEWAQMAKAHSELKSNLHALQSQLQHTATRNEELCQALDFLQHEHAELQQRADSLQQDNQLQAKRIGNIEGKLQKEQNQKLILEATISHLHNLMQNQTNEQKTQEVVVQRKDQVFTMQNPPLTPAKEMQNAMSEHPKEKAEESLRNEMQERTFQLTAKEKECQELRAELEALSEEYRCCLSCLRQCRQELNQSQMVKVGPTLTPSLWQLHITLGNTPLFGGSVEG